MPQALPSLKIKLRIPPQASTSPPSLLKQALTPPADAVLPAAKYPIARTTTPMPAAAADVVAAPAKKHPGAKRGRASNNTGERPDADRVMGPPPAKRPRATGPRGPRKVQSIAPAVTPGEANAIMNGNGRSKAANGKVTNGRGRGGARSMTPNVELASADSSILTLIPSFKEGSPMSVNLDSNQDAQSVASVSRAPIIIDKNSRPRLWNRRRVVIRTLDGGVLEIPVWCSTNPMLLNHEQPYPATYSPNSTPAPLDPDALFFLTGLAHDKDFRPYLCTHPGCTKAFTTLDQLASHESKMHGARDVICGVDGCTRGFATKGQLIKHQKMVHFRRPGMGRRKKGTVATVVTPVATTNGEVKEELGGGEEEQKQEQEEEEEEEEDPVVKQEVGGV